MTLALAREARKVVAVEIDPKLVDILKNKMAGYSNIEVIQRDVLRIDFERLLGDEARPVKVVANLPYQISTPLLFRFVESRRIFDALTLMLQGKSRKDGRSSRREGIRPLVRIDPGSGGCLHPLYHQTSAFFPPPKVESAVVQIAWKERPLIGPEHEDWFRAVVKGCLGYRRKTLANALKHSDLALPERIDERLERINVDPRRRPGTLTIEEFARLATALKS